MANQAFDEVKDWFISYFQYISDIENCGELNRLYSLEHARGKY